VLAVVSPAANEDHQLAWFAGLPAFNVTSRSRPGAGLARASRHCDWASAAAGCTSERVRLLREEVGSEVSSSATWPVARLCAAVTPAARRPRPATHAAWPALATTPGQGAHCCSGPRPVCVLAGHFYVQGPRHLLPPWRWGV